MGQQLLRTYMYMYISGFKANRSKEMNKDQLSYGESCVILCTHICVQQFQRKLLLGLYNVLITGMKHV